MEDTNVEQPQVAPRKPRARAVQQVEEPESINRLIATDDKDDYAIIRLHTSDEIPPGGVPFGVNGRNFIMTGDVWYKVPSWLLSSIDNIITEKPIKDGADKFIGTRPMKKYPYEVWRG